MSATTRVRASDIKPGDHFWVRKRLHLANAVMTSERGTMIAASSADLWFAPGTEVDRVDW